MTKRCTTCRRECPIEQFSKNRSTKDGLQYECKDCVRSYKQAYYTRERQALSQKSKVHYQKNRDRVLAQVKANYQKNRRRFITYRAQWSKLNPEKQREYARRNYQNDLGGHAEYRRLYNQVNWKKRRAHAKVAAALRKGVLVRPQACQRCGTSGRVDAHHPNYDKPLMVDWLCRSCHQTEHAKSAA